MLGEKTDGQPTLQSAAANLGIRLKLGLLHNGKGLGQVWDWTKNRLRQTALAMLPRLVGTGSAYGEERLGSPEPDSLRAIEPDVPAPVHETCNGPEAS